MRRHVVPAVVVALLAGILSPAQAAKREPGTYFRAQTAGLPVSTMFGEWSEEDGGRSVELTFNGGHAIGADTTIEAGWLSPWTPAGEAPEFDYGYSLTNENTLGEKIVMEVALRMREKGKGWEPWITDRVTLRPGGSAIHGGSFGIIFLSEKGHKWRPMQFEWRLESVMTAPTYLEGSYDFRIN